MLKAVQIQVAEVTRILVPLLGSRSAHERAANIISGQPKTVSEIMDAIYRGQVAATRRGWDWKNPAPGRVRLAAIEILQILLRE